MFWRYLKAENSLSRLVTNCFMTTNFKGQWKKQYLLIWPCSSSLWTRTVWPVTIVVVCRGAPTVPKANITRKRGKDAFENYQEGHHFEICDNLPKLFQPISKYFKVSGKILLLYSSIQLHRVRHEKIWIQFLFMRKHGFEAPGELSIKRRATRWGYRWVKFWQNLRPSWQVKNLEKY